MRITNPGKLAVALVLTLSAICGAASAQERRFRAKGVDVEYLEGKTYQKDGYLDGKKYKSKIASPKVIWSSKENVFEDQAMAQKRIWG